MNAELLKKLEDFVDGAVQLSITRYRMRKTDKPFFYLLDPKKEMGIQRISEPLKEGILTYLAKHGIVSSFSQTSERIFSLQIDLGKIHFTPDQAERMNLACRHHRDEAMLTRVQAHS